MFFIVITHVLSLLLQLKVSIDLKWEKWKLEFISVLLQMFFKSITSLMNFVEITDFD